MHSVLPIADSVGRENSVLSRSYLENKSGVIIS